jgi:hypothetical protein
MWRANFCGRRGWSEEDEAFALMDGGCAAEKTKRDLCLRQAGFARRGGLTMTSSTLFCFLHGFEVGFQGGAVLFLGF